MIRTLLLDDDIDSLEILKALLSIHCPDIEIIGTLSDPDNAVKFIKKNKPDLIITDLTLKEISLFDLIEKFSTFAPEMIFLTEDDNSALKALRLAAAGYLIKPVDAIELRAAVEKVKKRLNRPDRDKGKEDESIDIDRFEMAAFPVKDGLKFIKKEDIIYCHSDGNYTNVVLVDPMADLYLSKNLKEVVRILDDNRFIRVHKSFLVNFSHIVKFSRIDGGLIEMSNGDLVRVARSKRGLFSHL